MEKSKALETIKHLREFSKKRNFKQSVDLIINLKEINVKKQDSQVDQYTVLPHPRKKKLKICALVGSELAESAKVFDEIVVQQDFPKYQANPELINALTKKFDLFVAQANIMTQIATTFGRTLGPKGLMPNPKAGCVVDPGANLSAVSAKLQKTVRLQAKKEPIIKVSVGSEDMGDDDLVENIMSVYNNLVHSLPQEEGNVKSVLLKTTMGSPIKIGDKREEIEAKLKGKEKPKKETKKAGKKVKQSKKEIKNE